MVSLLLAADTAPRSVHCEALGHVGAPSPLFVTTQLVAARAPDACARAAITTSANAAIQPISLPPHIGATLSEAQQAGENLARQWCRLCFFFGALIVARALFTTVLLPFACLSAIWSLTGSLSNLAMSLRPRELTLTLMVFVFPAETEN